MTYIAETPMHAARRLAAKALRDGFEFIKLHEYKDHSGGDITYWRIRLKHPNFDGLSPEKQKQYKGKKWIRPMHWDSERFVIGEPKFPPEGKPLYGLHALAARADELVFLVEGENKVDALATLGLLAVTSGAVTSAGDVDLTPLTGRNIRIWHDNDEAGIKYAKAMIKKLRSLSCALQMVDVAALELPPKGDTVDWLEMHPHATAADVLQLAVLETTDNESDESNAPYDADDIQVDLKKIVSKAEELASLPPPVCDLRSRDCAKELGIGLRTLQREIKDARQRHRIAEAEKNYVPNESGAPGELEVQQENLPATARAVDGILTNDPRMFFRGKPACVSFDSQVGGQTIQLMNVENVVNAVHDHVQPFQWIGTQDGQVKEPITLPDRVARLYLALGNPGLRPLDGIASSPLLSDDGSIRAVEGYDPATKLLCENVPAVIVPDIPTKDQAQESLRLLRYHFRTFAFADAIKVFDEALGVEVVDIIKPPGEDESAALVALFTAVCRASLHLAPGLKVSAAAYSGAGTGKGLLVRVICAIAMGIHPRAISSGGNLEELDKRITAELIGANPVLFLDNLNGTTLRSDVLASVLTERPASARKLGKSEILRLNSSAFVAVTGNGLLLSEDMTRRFVRVDMDAGENPESRPFKGNLLAETLANRAELLSAVLTIWRWGRQSQPKAGKILGSFEQWGEWCRDPLLALGCADPVERVLASKMDDPERRFIAEVFDVWWERHQNNLVTVAALDILVRDILDPQHRGRQYLAAQVRKLEGTRLGGFVLTRSDSGPWDGDKYQLQKLNSGQQKEAGDFHGYHREHQAPMPPMVPMPQGGHDQSSNNFNSGGADYDEEQAIRMIESIV